MKLVPEDSQLLRTKLEPFDFKNPSADPVKLVKLLVSEMNQRNGIGLAANQLGLKERVFVMKTEPVICCFNPRIVEVSEETILLDEGCLSYPGLFVKIKRPKMVVARYADINGEMVTKTFDGLTARCFLHELDHLEGKIFFENANPIHLKQAKQKRVSTLRKMKKLQKLRKEIKDKAPKVEFNDIEPIGIENKEFSYSTGG